MARCTRRPWWLCAVGVLAACSASAEPDAPESDARVVLGTGEVEFEAIDGEPPLPLVAGVQGGFHVWASFLAYGFESKALSLVVTTTWADVPGTELVMRAKPTAREVLDDTGTPAFSFAGFPAQIADARCADGQRIRVQIDVSTLDGLSASDTRHCIAMVEPAQRHAECP